jgi:hypothetical protein
MKPSPMPTVLRAIGEEVTEPDPKGTAEAFSQTGYRFELAVADIIDNSIDADAKWVLIRLFTDENSITRIVLADDGHGMAEPVLRKAMQYGAQVTRRAKDLGRYGVGMKSASLSQCRDLSVLSRHAGLVAGRRWTERSIRAGWHCDILDPLQCAELVNRPWGPLDLINHGTLVVWDGLDRLHTDRLGLERTIDHLFRLLNIHLGLTFHRFLGNGSLRIQVDRADSATGQAGLPTTVQELDPFAYPATGMPTFPKDFVIETTDAPAVAARAHVWPPKSKAAGYRLGGGQVASRQGFYFYRNERLIQAGGWNGWRESDNEPHLSLARTSIDLHADADRAFGLSLHKSAIDVPTSFVGALDRARAEDQTTFRDYISAAQEAYRTATAGPTDRRAVPTPGKGLPRRVRSAARRATAGRDPNVRPFGFVWRTMPFGSVVEIDRENDLILLNARYRATLGDGPGGSSNDAPVVKLLIFAALRSQLDRERTSAPLRRELADLNSLLKAALVAIEAINEGG